MYLPSITGFFSCYVKALRGRLYMNWAHTWLLIVGPVFLFPRALPYTNCFSNCINPIYKEPFIVVTNTFGELPTFCSISVCFPMLILLEISQSWQPQQESGHGRGVNAHSWRKIACTHQGCIIEHKTLEITKNFKVELLGCCYTQPQIVNELINKPDYKPYTTSYLRLHKTERLRQLNFQE